MGYQSHLIPESSLAGRFRALASFSECELFGVLDVLCIPKSGQIVDIARGSQSAKLDSGSSPMHAILARPTSCSWRLVSQPSEGPKSKGRSNPFLMTTPLVQAVYREMAIDSGIQRTCSGFVALTFSFFSQLGPG